jgi:hypothetical protein
VLRAFPGVDPCASTLLSTGRGFDAYAYRREIFSAGNQCRRGCVTLKTKALVSRLA